MSKVENKQCLSTIDLINSFNFNRSIILFLSKSDYWIMKVHCILRYTINNYSFCQFLHKISKIKPRKTKKNINFIIILFILFPFFSFYGYIDLILNRNDLFFFTLLYWVSSKHHLRSSTTSNLQP